LEENSVKKSTVVSLIVLWALSLFASSGYSQTSNYPALTVKVPFAFVVGNQTFPAGTYKFRSLLKSVPSKAAIDVLEVRSAEGRLYQAIVTDVVGSEKPNDPKLVFTRSGGRAFLSEVWEAGRQAGCRLQPRNDATQAAEGEGENVTLVALAER
jgi:hypothetical protein